MGFLKSKLVERGANIVIPIIGFYVEEIHIRHRQMPRFIFSKVSDRYTLDIWSSNIQILRGSDEILNLRGGEISIQYQSKMIPVLELIGCEVVDSYAEKKGVLRLEFSNKMMLIVKPEGYEGWQIKGGDIGLIGDDGRLI